MNICKARLIFLYRFVFAGFCLAVLFHAVMYHVFAAADPWGSFLFDKHDRFNDWHNSVASATSRDPYYKHGPTAIANYFPFTYVLCLPGVFMSKRASVTLFFLVATALFSTALTVYYRIFLRPALNTRSLRYFIALLIAVGCSYPWIFAMDRANIEAWVSILSLIFVLLRHSRFFWMGALALSIAISIKGYPTIFLILLVSERRYGAAAAIVGMAILLTLSALLVLEGGVIHMLQGVHFGLKGFYNSYIVGPMSANYSTDPFNGLRILTGWIHQWHDGVFSIPASSHRVRIYTVFSTLFALTAISFALFVPTPAWRQMMAVCLSALLFPNVANDYKLLVLLPGLLMLLVAREEGWRETLALWCLAFLMIPKQYYYIDGITISTVISPVLVLMLAGLVLIDRPAWRAGMDGFYAKVRWYLAGLQLNCASIKN